MGGAIAHAADLELVSQWTVPLYLQGLIHEVLDNFNHHLSVVFNAHDEIANCHQGAQLLVFGVEIIAHGVHLCQLADGFDELVGRAGELRLEEGKPEDLCINVVCQDLADLSLEVGIDDVLHIDGVEVVRPRMKDLEALVLDLLLPVSFDVTSEELESGLVGLDRVAEVVLSDWLALPQEGADRLDAGGTLKILRIN